MLRTCGDFSVQLLASNLPILNSSSWESCLHVTSQLYELLFNKVKYKEHFSVLWKLQTDCNLEVLEIRNRHFLSSLALSSLFSMQVLNITFFVLIKMFFFGLCISIMMRGQNPTTPPKQPQTNKNQTDQHKIKPIANKQTRTTTNSKILSWQSVLKLLGSHFSLLENLLL